jgi:hexosaminidase
VSEAHAAASDWKLLGKDVAAVSPDCPFLTHGDASSLAVCQAGCANDGACNEINWNPTIPDCVYRACDNPLAPVLTPTPGYDVYGIEKAALAMDPNDFVFLPVGAVSDVLVSAMRRYASMAFVYSNASTTQPGAPSPVYRLGARLGGGQVVTGDVRGLVINVTSPDADLSEGVDESYNLTVTADPAPGGSGGLPYGSVLTATTVFGALRGLETFVQLIQWNASSGAYSIQHTDVVDYPRFPFRGVLVDTARHFIPLSNLMAIVDAMAAVKLNAMHIHLSGA